MLPARGGATWWIYQVSEWHEKRLPSAIAYPGIWDVATDRRSVPAPTDDELVFRLPIGGIEIVRGATIKPDSYTCLLRENRPGGSRRVCSHGVVDYIISVADCGFLLQQHVFNTKS